MHAVSVGEVLSTLELVRRLRAEFPRAPLFLSTTTLAGYATAQEKLAGIAAGVFYAPIDNVFAVSRVLRTLRPSLVVILETEIWPNLFREAKRAGCGLVIVNGRISDRTESRYRKQRWFFGNVLRWPDAVLVQDEVMRERYLAMGAPAERVKVGGNQKYDMVPRKLDPQSSLRLFLEGLKPAEVWVAASTMPPGGPGDVDEDDVVIEVFQDLAARHQSLLLVLAPRKPERFDVVADKLAATGIRYIRRSQLGGPLELPGVLLLDSIGELSGVFALADVVFMGGTLAVRGGHNILEPAFFARPVICGPHMENFREIANEFRASGACVEIVASAQLAGALDELLTHRDRAIDIGRRALECAHLKRGATERAIEVIRGVSAKSCPCVRPNLAAVLFLWPVSLIWRWVGQRNRRRQRRQRQRLNVPVISVGNITMGGTGKTPLVLYLAGQMRRAGRSPGILTRGYGRHSLDKNLILEPGARVKVAQSGDEPQIFLRASVAPVGIGSNRWQTGQLLQQRFGADIMILDDGFQHVRLDRQVDIVLIDALTPFGGCEVFPLGRLRESLAELGRADVIVITRSECARGTYGLEQNLRRYNTDAPIFHARSVAEYWVNAASGSHAAAGELPFSRVGAFCGLGNPEGFRCTLESLGIQPADFVMFGDHHTYHPREMRRLAHQFQIAKVEAAVTTEKDAINLCEGCVELMAPVRVYWLKIRTEIERETEFLQFIESRVGVARPGVNRAS